MELQDLGNNIFFHKHRPVEEGQRPHGHNDTSHRPPALIVICTWQGGATTRRIAKYVFGYRKLYPTASILVLRTELADMVYRTFNVIHSRLKPARDILLGFLCQSQGAGGSSGGVLLHMFSHGGCNIAIQLVASLPKDMRAQLHRRLQLVVADCCPGDGTFEETYRAGLLSLPPRMPFRLIGKVGLYGTVSAIYALNGAGVMKSVPDLRDELNDPENFGQRARRLYLISDRDNILSSQDMISHAQLAEESGYKISLVRFDQAVHCALVLEDPIKYWNAIHGSWAEATTVPLRNKL